MSPDSSPAEIPANMWNMLTEMRAGIATLTAGSDFNQRELSAIRQRIHDLANQFNPLMTIPAEVKEMRGQHTDLKAQITKLAEKVDSVVPIVGRVEAMEPIVRSLNDDRNRNKGALIAVAGVAGFFGSLLGLAIGILGLIFHRG